MSESKKQPGSERLRSVDALRGFDMFWIVGAGAIAKALGKMDENAATTLLTTQLTHVTWEGFRFYDLIFPLFLFIIGISIVFSLDKALAKGGRVAVLKRVFLRGVLLFALGIFYYGGVSNGWSEIALGGVLHRIAACYVLAALIYTFVRSTKGLAITAAVLLVGYWAMLTLIPFPDLQLDKETVEAAAGTAGSDSPFQIAAATESKVSGLYEEGRNLTNFVDFLFLRGRRAQTYYINEGLLSTIPAIALSLFGILAGRLLKSADFSPPRKIIWLLGAGAAGIALGLLWSLQFPLIKRIWTSSFILVAGGLSAWILALFYYLIDVKKWRVWCQPFIWIGCNALIVYLGARLIPFNKIATYFVGGDVAKFLNQRIAEGMGAVAIATVSLLLIFLCTRFLYRRGIFIRV
tara:strand:- start:1798 stop:3015 length:1218 start_codon:yes stop_codon:yes gene_type:complete